MRKGGGGVDEAGKGNVCCNCDTSNNGKYDSRSAEFGCSFTDSCNQIRRRGIVADPASAAPAGGSAGYYVRLKCEVPLSAEVVGCTGGSAAGSTCAGTVAASVAGEKTIGAACSSAGIAAEIGSVIVDDACTTFLQDSRVYGHNCIISFLRTPEALVAFVCIVLLNLMSSHSQMHAALRAKMLFEIFPTSFQYNIKVRKEKID